MKRKHATATATTTATQADEEAPHALPDKKRARAGSKAHEEGAAETELGAQEALGTLDVQGFLLRDCRASSRKLIEQAKLRSAELRREMEAGKKALVDALEAEKENVDEHGNAIPRGYKISVHCIEGLYRGRKFSMDLDLKRHPSCFVGRSTGRKFRSPRGLSMPKDSELSTSHAEIKMEATGKVFFTDLDSTNGSWIDDEALTPHEPFEVRTDKPFRVFVGAGVLEFTFQKKM